MSIFGKGEQCNTNSSITCTVTCSTVLNANIYHVRQKASIVLPYVISMSAKQRNTLDSEAAINKRNNTTKILFPYHLQSHHLQNHPQIHHHPYYQSFHLPNHHHLLLQSCQVWSSKTAQCSDAACVLYPKTKTKKLHLENNFQSTSNAQLYMTVKVELR